MPKYCTGARGFNHETQSCCERHDADYAAYSVVDRSTADAALLICVTAHGMPWRAIAMFLFVRAFGWIFYQDRLGRVIRRFKS